MCPLIGTAGLSFIDALLDELCESGRTGIGNADGAGSSGRPLPAAEAGGGIRPEVEVEVVGLGDPRIEEAWVRLQDQGHVDSPFMCWQWYSAMRDCAELVEDVRVLACSRRSRIIGLLPVERLRRGRLRVVGIAGWHWAGTDHVDVIAAPADRSIVAHAVLSALAGGSGWDVLDFDGLRVDGALAAAMNAAFGGPWFLRRSDQRISVTCVPLTGEFVSSHARKKTRQDLRRAEEAGGGFSTVTDPEQFPVLLQEMMDLHIERFGDRSRVFASAARRRFHVLASRRLGAAGFARLHLLEYGDVPAAINYTLTWRDTIYFYSSGLRAGLGINPGFTARVAAMSSAHEDGFGDADLLRGDHAYKSRFRSIVRDDVRKRVVRVSPRSVVAAVTRAGRHLAIRPRRRGEVAQAD